MTTSVFYED